MPFAIISVIAGILCIIYAFVTGNNVYTNGPLRFGHHYCYYYDSLFEFFSAFPFYWIVIVLGIILVIVGFVLPKKTVKTQPPIVKTSGAEELKKYKELLDSGIITQDEFEAKKKQILK